MSTPEKIVQFMVNAVGQLIAIGLLLGILIAPLYIAFHFLEKYW